jgi:alkanesulfonate monooxygenase SsuD/methylene tetrahydromethanopterin reductase-like flavin-dependent oxidoreductase (luciferase family)
VPIRFGATIVQTVPYGPLRDDFLFADSIGLDNAWVVDHFALDPAPDLVILEAWTVLAAVAAETEHVRVGTMVTNVAMRNPALLAKAALTVDQISGGRLDLAVGGGFYPQEHAAVGIDFLDGTGRVERLREAVEILDQALRGEHVTHEGTHFRLEDAPFHPAPTQQPRPPLWVAAQTRGSLRTAVRHADVAICLGTHGKPLDESVAGFRSRMEMLDELCAEEGRDPRSLRRCYFAGWGDEPLFESPESTTEIVGRYVEAGATDFTFYLHNPAAPGAVEQLSSHRIGTREQFEHLVSEVLPAFRG